LINRVRVTLAIVAACVAAPAIAAGAAGTVVFPDAGPESQLATILGEIEKNRIDAALQKTEALLLQYPNFRLGHLIKGDLLLARSKPLETFGNADNAPREKLSDLRDEALVRIKAYREKPALADQLPSSLLQMEPGQKHAMLVDTQKSRLYLYENDGGRPRFVADYYVTQGKSGADKMREGDRKTPLGVYHVTAALSAKKLSDLYGTGAFPINYPNEWDKRQGRKGHGIWLHGTPADTYSRPPKASEGCVVLSNADLEVLAKNVQVGVTPVIISDSIEWLSPGDWQREREGLRREVEAWRLAWESGDVDRLLAHYSRAFQTDKQNFAEFAARKRQVLTGKEWVKIDLSRQSMFRSPGKDGVVFVTFDQQYTSNNFKNLMKKRQYWIREDGRWKIIYEGSA
jgi:murein L,D-transpeptidase YafK